MSELIVPSVNFEQEILDLSGSGQFSSGTILVTKVGKIVNILGLTDFSFSSSSVPATASGFMPQKYRSALLAPNVSRFDSDRVVGCYVSQNGVFSLHFISWSGVAESRTWLPAAFLNTTYTSI